MPLDNRYVVAAFDGDGERLAFITPAFEWVQSARKATIFQSQIDANAYIKTNELHQGSDSKTTELANFDHAKPLLVRVEIKDTSPNYDPNFPDRGISFSGISG